MLQHNAGRALFTVIFALVCLGSSGDHKRAMGQGPDGVGNQRLKAPTIPELVEEHQDLTYEGLAEALPGEPAYRRTLGFDPTKARYFDLVHKELDGVL